MQDKPYKKSLKIVMYEVWSTLATPNAFVDIENTVDKKMNLLKINNSP